MRRRPSCRRRTKLTVDLILIWFITIIIIIIIIIIINDDNFYGAITRKTDSRAPYKTVTSLGPISLQLETQ